MTGQTTAEFQELPIVDLAVGEEVAARELYQACTQQGFFYLAGHGVPPELLHSVFDQSAKFFSLDLDAKMKVSTLHSNCGRGFTPMAEETLDPANQRVGDTKEGFYIGLETGPPSALTGPNQWPDETSLSGWRTTMEQYQREMVALGRKLTRVLALSLSLPAEFLDSFFQNPLATLRLLHYSAVKSDLSDGVCACGAHTDYGVLTFLATQSGDEELQVLRRDAHDETWMNVRHMEGAFVVNVGDMLERWTNGAFVSTRHRVVNESARERYSVPFFWDTGFFAEIACLPTCSSASSPPRFEPIVFGRHIVAKYEQTHRDYKKTV